MSYKFKYADLLIDDVFKLVFGRESTKDVMIEFLNQVIPDRKIEDLEFIDKEMHPVERDSKGSVYDMFCKTDDGSRIIVEVQRRKQPFYPERALYYSTFQIQRQVEAGTEEYDFLPVYVVNILDFLMEKNSTCQKVKTTYRLYEDESHKLLTNKVTFIFIELPKFKKSLKELDGNILEGMYFCFKHISRLKEKPRVLDHQIFTKIFETTEFYNMDEETRNKVLAKMTTERDLRNQMRYARNEAIEEGRAKGLAQGLAQGLAEGKAEGLAQGLAEGRAEGKAEGLAQGLAEGRAEAKAEAIRKMLEAKLPIEQVAAIMEMSVEEIHNLEK
jgi:predicted transposase/invertase (TIGR01784 family)